MHAYAIPEPVQAHLHSDRRSPTAEWVLEPLRARRSLLRGLCRRWTRGNPQDAEDLFGEACVRVLEALREPGLEVGDPLAFWATIIGNLGRDRHRRRVRGPLLEPLGETEIGAVRNESALEARESLQALFAAAELLPNAQCMALASRSLGLEYEDIADALAVSNESTRKLVQCARHTLRCTLESAPRKANNQRDKTNERLRHRVARPI